MKTVILRQYMAPTFTPAVKEKPPRLGEDAGRRGFAQIRAALANSGYWCLDCQGPTTLIFSDHGLPNSCAKCGGYHVRLKP
jgi:hypothetical protein